MCIRDRIADLAIAVFAGVILSALRFAWEHAKHVQITAQDTDGHVRQYRVEGTLFFASTAEFLEQFVPEEDPDAVDIDFAKARLMDHSAIEAVNTLAERYRHAGKQLRLRHLSEDCRELLDKARDMVIVDYREDPRYRVADDALA